MQAYANGLETEVTRLLEENARLRRQVDRVSSLIVVGVHFQYMGWPTLINCVLPFILFVHFDLDFSIFQNC